MGHLVNTLAIARPSLLAVMDELATWRDVERALETLGRGARNRLAKHLQMDPSYLLRKLRAGDDLTTTQARAVKTFFDTASGKTSQPGEMEPDAPRRRVPVYGYAAAGGGDLIAMNPGEIIEWIELPAGLDPKGDIFVVRTVGSSMEPRIFPGETLVIQRRLPPARGKDAIIEFHDGSGVVKTFQGQRDGFVFAWQYNPGEERRYDASKVKAIHSVYCRL